MTCPITMRLGVYALGAADTAERELVESHLPACRECQVELALLEPLPKLLARVPPNLVRAGRTPARSGAGAPPPRITRRAKTPAGGTRARNAGVAAGSWRRVAGAAAAAALAVAGGYWLGQQAADRQPAAKRPAAITLSGADPVTHVRVTMTLTGTSWGTSIRLRARGLPLDQPCRLIVRSRTGGIEVAGVWDAWRSGPISVPASAGWRPADISSLQVATATRNLVTVTTARRDEKDR